MGQQHELIQGQGQRAGGGAAGGRKGGLSRSLGKAAIGDGRDNHASPRASAAWRVLLSRRGRRHRRPQAPGPCSPRCRQAEMGSAEGLLP